MARKKHSNSYSSPPEPRGAVPHGGQSEASQLQWVLVKQQELGERAAGIETSLDYIADTLKRIEDKLDDVGTKTDKNSTTLTRATAAIVTGTAVAAFFIYGKFDKIHEYMQKHEAKPAVTTTVKITPKLNAAPQTPAKPVDK